jgi:hypothetical protein
MVMFFMVGPMPAADGFRTVMQAVKRDSRPLKKFWAAKIRPLSKAG